MKTFIYFFLPRLFLSLLFDNINHYGIGGDNFLYMFLGKELASLKTVGYENILNSDLLKNNFDLGDDDDYTYRSIISKLNESLIDGDYWGLYRNNVMPISIIHAFIYYLKMPDITFPILVSFINSIIYSKIFNNFELSKLQKFLLIVNPFSVYYSSVHLKEGLTEFILLYFVYSYYLNKKMILIFSIIFLSFFRFEFLAIPFVLILTNKISLNIKPILFLMILFILINIFPYYGFVNTPPSSTGIILSFLYSNIYITRTLGIIIGFFSPLPFSHSLSESNYIGGVFHLIFGFFNLYLNVKIFKQVFRNNLEKHIIKKLNIIILFEFLFSYYYVFVFQGYKERYFSSLIPILIILLFSINKDLINRNNLKRNIN